MCHLDVIHTGDVPRDVQLSCLELIHTCDMSPSFFVNLIHTVNVPNIVFIKLIHTGDVSPRCVVHVKLIHTGNI